MSKRKLKRQRPWLQVIMLGAAGAIAAGIFVLTNHAAGMVVPAAVLALLIGGVLGLFSLAYYVAPVIARWIKDRALEAAPDRDLILIAAVNPQTVKSLMHLAAAVAEGSDDTYVCMMSVLLVSSDLPLEMAQRMARQLRPQQHSFFSLIASEMAEKNIAMYSKVRAANSVAEGILEEIESRSGVRLLLIGWPGNLDAKSLAQNPVKVALKKARTNVAVLLDRGLRVVNRILVPVGGGPHSRLALRLANVIAMADNAQVTALHLRLASDKAGSDDAEELEDRTLLLSDIVENALEEVPATLQLKVAEASSVRQGIIDEANSQPYDLILMGASEEWTTNHRLLGTIDDWVAEHAPCSVVLCRHYAPVTISWLRYQVKMIEHEYEKD